MSLYNSIVECQNRIFPILGSTPCKHMHGLSESLAATIYLKLESMHRTGSFKERGALNFLLQAPPQLRQAGVVCASAGNHGQAVAYHAKRLDIPSTVFMPLNTPLTKIQQTENWQANVVLEGDNYDAAFLAAQRYCDGHKATYIHAYEDERVIAGQGTIGLELLEQIKNLDVVLVPVGGGGLISGIAAAIKTHKPKLRIIGVQSAVLPAMLLALKSDKQELSASARSLADGIAVRKVGAQTQAHCTKFVDDWITVEEEEIARAIVYLLEKHKVLAEGAGAVTTAALLANKVAGIQGKTVAAVLSGGNIDVNLLERVIERGLVETARLIKLSVRVPDRPGSLAGLLSVLGESGVNVIEVHHQRGFAETSWKDVLVELILETRGRKHVQELLSLLLLRDYHVVSLTGNQETQAWQNLSTT